MNKLTTIITAVALTLGAAADIVSVPLVNGSNIVGHPGRIIAVKAASHTSSGTISIKEIVNVSSSSVSSHAVTNITPTSVVSVNRDAVVNQTIVHSGTDTDWNKWNKSVTNITDGVTNVVVLKLAQWHDGSVTNSLIYTNLNCRIERTESVRPGLATNVTTRFVTTWTDTPFTNDLYSGTLSGGKLSATTNIVILGGNIDVGGTAITNGNAYIVLER